MSKINHGISLGILFATVLPAAGADLPNEKDVRYVSEGRFLKKGKFDGEKFTSVLSSAQALKEADAQLAKKLWKGLGKHAPQEAKKLRLYFSSYREKVCSVENVTRSAASDNFKTFYARTVRAEDLLEGACNDLKKKREAEALEKLNEAVKLSPEYSALYLHRALAYYRMADAASAGTNYREALKTPKDTPRDAGLEDCVCASVLGAEVQILADLHAKSQKAKKEGTALFVSGDAKGAALKFSEAIKSDPSDPESYVSRAIARHAAGESSSDVISDYMEASKTAASEGRLDIAVDSLLSCVKIEGGDEKKILPIAVDRLTDLIGLAEPSWKRKAAVSEELAKMRKRLEEIAPADSGEKKGT